MAVSHLRKEAPAHKLVDDQHLSRGNNVARRCLFACGKYPAEIAEVSRLFQAMQCTQAFWRVRRLREEERDVGLYKHELDAVVVTDGSVHVPAQLLTPRIQVLVAQAAGEMLAASHLLRTRFKGTARICSISRCAHAWSVCFRVCSSRKRAAARRGHERREDATRRQPDLAAAHRRAAVHAADPRGLRRQLRPVLAQGVLTHARGMRVGALVSSALHTPDNRSSPPSMGLRVCVFESVEGCLQCACACASGLVSECLHARARASVLARARTAEL
eukprot:3338970-Pleurochrysis_carterae.AAC.2